MTELESELQKRGVDLSTRVELFEESSAYVIPGGAAAVELWHELSKVTQNLGAWPVLCGNSDLIKSFEDYREYWKKSNVAEILKKVPVGSLPSYRKDRRQQLEQMKAMMKQRGIEIPAALEQGFAAALIQEERARAKPDFTLWPASPADEVRKLTSAFDLEKIPYEKCLLALAQTTKPWELPAYFRFGGYNDCPPSEVHVAYLRHWNEEYGAVPIGMTHDVIEMFVPNPPASPEDAWKLACEQEDYCSDIVFQGTQTVERLAMELWRSPYWYFWWD